MADLNRRAMLGLSAAAMASSLAACTETPRSASAAVTTKRCFDNKVVLITGQMVIDGGKTAHAG
jgi:hypothetical protein